ncbi:hypothetical protein BDZ89DRAFT_1156047 [Hymenopellis radicata]|nr:hypothetical protein BDZ89DRAFT_1156047 [Hymenopellis radicata]
MSCSEQSTSVVEANGTINRSNLSNYSDAEIRELTLKAVSYRFDESGTSLSSAAALLSHDLVTKQISVDGSHVPGDEISSMELADSLGIRVPKIHRVVPNAVFPSSCQIVMDRIYGVTLEEAWADLGWWSTLKVAWQLRCYVNKMRSVTSITAGGLASGSAHCMAWALDVYGPELHASPSNLRDYMNWWLQNPQPTISGLEIKPFPYFVFSHLDLHMGNMIIDEQKNLWLIDWGQSGYYPVFMEYARFRFKKNRVLASDGTGSIARWKQRLRFWRWRLFRWIAVGHYSWEARALAVIGNRSTRHARARKGFPSERATREAARRAARESINSARLVDT